MVESEKESCYHCEIFSVKCVDHCVVVNMSEKVIIDCAGEKHLKFSIDMLNMCGVSDVLGLHIGEVCQVVKQMGKNKVKDDTAADFDREVDDGVNTVEHSSIVIEIVD